MNKLRQVLLGGGLVLTTVTAQAADISGNVTLATDYVYRGVTQTSGEAAVQGGFDILADNGLYAGIWGSNIAFDGSVEIDYFVGFSNEVFEGFGYDVGVLHYDYPNQPAGSLDSDFEEIYFNFTYKAFTFGAAYSNDFFDETEIGVYSYGEYELSLPSDISLVFHYGAQKIDKAITYDEFSISLSKEIADISFSLAYYDTDENGIDDFDNRVVFALSKSL